MKAWVLLVVIALALLGQDRRAAEYDYEVGPFTGGIRIVGTVVDKTMPTGPGGVRMAAGYQHYAHALIETDSMVMTADDVVYNRRTHEIRATGNVWIKLEKLGSGGESIVPK